jgi:multidrug efflux pump subunit AcrA (membrane-fusion protein)
MHGLRELHPVQRRPAAPAQGHGRRTVCAAPARTAPRCISCSKTASELPRTGRLLFSDLNVDAASGQVTLRAEVPNPDGLLLPGQYVRVRLAQAELPAGMLLPQQAVTRSNQGDTVLVVGADGVPAKRQIKLGGNQNNQWIVLVRPASPASRSSSKVSRR